MDKSARSVILEYSNPFSYMEMVDYLVFLGFDSNESDKAFEDLYDEGLLYYEKVLAERLGNQGYAFITDAYYDKRILNYTNKRLDEMNIVDENTRNNILLFAKEIASKAYLNDNLDVLKKTR